MNKKEPPNLDSYGRYIILQFLKGLILIAGFSIAVNEINKFVERLVVP